MKRTETDGEDLMADNDKEKQKPPSEPRYMPSQAEGDAGQDDERVEHLRTPGQAEGKKDDVEESLREKEDDSSRR